MRAQKKPLWMNFCLGQWSSVMERALDQESGVSESSFSKRLVFALEKDPHASHSQSGLQCPHLKNDGAGQLQTLPIERFLDSKIR